MNSKLHVDVVTCRNARSVERPEENDLQVELTVRELKQLVGEAQLAALTETSGFPTSFTTIKLRRCSAVIGQCINFHTDFFSKRTMQVALSGAKCYGGGELIYVNSTGLHVPPRPIGSATIHGAGAAEQANTPHIAHCGSPFVISLLAYVLRVRLLCIDILHGVTELTLGVRYGLFFLIESSW